MDDAVKRIEAKLDKVEEHIGSQAVTLARLTVSVEDHVKRTNILESELKPISKHVNMVEGAMKLLGAVAILATIVEAIHAIFK